MESDQEVSIQQLQGRLKQAETYIKALEAVNVNANAQLVLAHRHNSELVSKLYQKQNRSTKTTALSNAEDNRVWTTDNYNARMDEAEQEVARVEAEKQLLQAEKTAKAKLKAEADAWREAGLKKAKDQRKQDLAAWEEEKARLKAAGVRGMPKMPKAPTPWYARIPDRYIDCFPRQKDKQNTEGAPVVEDDERMVVDGHGDD